MNGGRVGGSAPQVNSSSSSSSPSSVSAPPLAATTWRDRQQNGIGSNNNTNLKLNSSKEHTAAAMRKVDEGWTDNQNPVSPRALASTAVPHYSLVNFKNGSSEPPASFASTSKESFKSRGVVCAADGTKYRKLPLPRVNESNYPKKLAQPPNVNLNQFRSSDEVDESDDAMYDDARQWRL